MTRFLFCSILIAAAVAGAACDRGTGTAVDARVASLYRHAVAHPDDIDGWLALNGVCMGLWEETDDPAFLDLAAESADRAVHIDSTSAGAWVSSARVLLDRNEFDDGIIILNRVLKRLGGGPKVWGLLGDAHLAMGDYRGADSSYFVMYELDSSFESLRRIGRVTAELREYEDAIPYLDRAIANGGVRGVEPMAIAAARVQRGELFLAHGALDVALEDADSALALRPESASAVALRARVLEAADRATEALAEFRRATTLSPHPRYLSELAACENLYGSSARADSILSMANERFREWFDRTPQLVKRDYIEFLLDWRIDDAQALQLAFADTRHRKDAEGYALLALAYSRNGRPDAAWSSMSIALRRGVHAPFLLHRAAVIAKAVGRLDKYDTYAERAREANPIIEKVYGPM